MNRHRIRFAVTDMGAVPRVEDQSTPLVLGISE